MPPIKASLAALVLLGVISNARPSEGPLPAFPNPQFGEPTFRVAKKACAAVDVKGVRYLSGRNGANMIWLRDILSSPKPDYYKEDGRLLRDGVAIFRLTLDPATGCVREVTVIQPSEFTTLDGCAVKALRSWRWKPGRWKEIEMPMYMSAFK
jgi:Gram-negative bacterial TonB protein C-terminal